MLTALLCVVVSGGGVGTVQGMDDTGIQRDGVPDGEGNVPEGGNFDGMSVEPVLLEALQLASVVRLLPAAVLSELVQQESRWTTDLVREEFRRWLLRNRGSSWASWAVAWNAFVACERGSVSVQERHCRECGGKGFSVRSYARGSLVCRGCRGDRRGEVFRVAVRPANLEHFK